MTSVALTAFSAAHTHKGHCRSVNEDAVFDDNESGVWAVADGMGGYAAGDVASRIVVDSLSRISGSNNSETFSDSIETLKQAILKANNKLFCELTLPQGCLQVGTTIAVLKYHTEENRCACLWVGDSRVYVLRGSELYQVTKDHSIVQEMVDKGVLDPDRRDTHPNSNVITRAVGVCDDLEVDVITFNPQPGDLFFLCSDGLYNEMDADQMLDCILASRKALATTQEYCDTIAKALINEVLKTEARDNVSVNVIVLA